jgi:p38 MAP kinase
MYHTSSSFGAPVLRQFKQRLPEKKCWVMGTELLDIDVCYELLDECEKGGYWFAKDSYFDSQLSIRVIRGAFEDIETCRSSLLEIKLRRHVQKRREADSGVHGLVSIMSPPRVGRWKDIYLLCPHFATSIDRVIQSKQVLSKQYIHYWAFLLLRGVHHMHATNVVHQDLQPANLLLTVNDDFWIKGFNNATLEGAPTTASTSGRSTFQFNAYGAPERLLPATPADRASDVWSAGCVLAELLNRKPLFSEAENAEELMEQVVHLLGAPSAQELQLFAPHPTLLDFMRSLPHSEPTFEATFPQLAESASRRPSSLDIDMLDLLKKMLALDPSTRITAAQALEHKMFAPFRDDDDDEEANLEMSTLFSASPGLHEMTAEQLRRALWHEMSTSCAGVGPVPPGFAEFAAEK